MALISGFLIQAFNLVGIVIACGFIIAQLNNLFYTLIGRNAYKICMITGLIGTPIHELAHASMCVLFGHKIHDIKLYQFDSSDGAMGYVSHSYNKKNPYQELGNFFIGVAPIFVGALVIYLLMLLACPNTLSHVNIYINEVLSVKFDLFSASTYEVIFNAIANIFRTIFAKENFLDWKWWLLMLFCLCIAPHMTLSKADISHCGKSLIILLAILLIVDVVLFIISLIISTNVLNSVTAFFVSMGMYLLNFLILAIILDVILVLIALIAKLIRIAIAKR